MDPAERRVLETLDRAVRDPAVADHLTRVADRVEARLEADPGADLAWEPIPLDLYAELPPDVRSSWVFVLRAGATTGGERHPNSRQRMTSWRGGGDFQTRPGEHWESHQLVNRLDAPLEDRWLSIPPNVWHQGVVDDQHWAVVSFQTATAENLIEERPVSGEESETVRKSYLERGGRD